MMKYFEPLAIFVVGMVAALFAWLMLPTLGTAGDQLATDTAAYSSVFWNWDVFANGNFLKFAVVFLLIMITLFATFKSFLKVR